MTALNTLSCRQTIYYVMLMFIYCHGELMFYFNFFSINVIYNAGVLSGLGTIVYIYRVRTKLESPLMSLNLKTKIQGLECP